MQPEGRPGHHEPITAATTTAAAAATAACPSIAAVVVFCPAHPATSTATSSEIPTQIRALIGTNDEVWARRRQGHADRFPFHVLLTWLCRLAIDLVLNPEAPTGGEGKLAQALLILLEICDFIRMVMEPFFRASLLLVVSILLKAG